MSTRKRGVAPRSLCGDDGEVDAELVLHVDDAADRNRFDAERGWLDREVSVGREARVGDLDVHRNGDRLRDVADGELTGDAQLQDIAASVLQRHAGALVRDLRMTTDVEHLLALHRLLHL